jgi:regulator of nonsense transcripts 2
VKNLILNYDLRDDNESDGESNFHTLLQSNHNRSILRPNQNRHNIFSSNTEQQEGFDKQHNPYAHARIDKAGNSRSTQRARKLQLSDVDWYGKSFSLKSRRAKSPAASALNQDGIEAVDAHVSSPTASSSLSFHSNCQSQVRHHQRKAKHGRPWKTTG